MADQSLVVQLFVGVLLRLMKKMICSTFQRSDSIISI